MHHKKGTKFLRFILLIWMILNLSILPFASAYSDDTPQISFTRKVSTSYLNGTFGKITAISSIKPSYSAQQSPKPSTYNLILFQDNQLSLQKTRNFILAQPNLFIMVTWSLFITLLACFIYFNHNKKSQLTIFFLLGIVLISVFFFMFYLKRSVTETKLKKEVKKMSSDTLETPAIKNYVQICLDDSVKEALILAGLQGGVVYSNYVNIFGLNIETGPSFDSSSDIGILGIPFVNYSVNYVPYLIYSIIRPRLDGSKYHPTVPGYPYEGNLRTLIEIDNFTVRNSLGNYLPSKPNKVSNLRALCSRQGSNYIDASVKFSCEEDLYNAASPHTVQTYLEEYIAQKVDNCIDFSSFIPETGFELEEGNISTEVLFGENNVYVTMEYPLKITVEGEAPVTKFLLYSTDLKIRFKKIYELAYHLIKEDVGNIFFDMETEANTLNNCPNFNVSSSTRNVFTRSCLESGMNITKYEDEEVCHDCDNGGNYSDVYMITDNQSLIEGKPFVFLFAVENRRPALDFIDYSVNSSFYYYGYFTTYYGRTPVVVYNKTSQPFDPSYNSNIIIDVGEPIEIFPLGIDPDNEENLTYSYSGWLTPIEIFNTSGISLDGGSYASNYWTSSNYYSGYYDPNPPFSPLIPPGIYKDANKNTNPSDVGTHWVRVNVTDKQGLSDYQDIKIQVRCNNSASYSDNDCCTEQYTYSSGSNCNDACMRCGTGGRCVVDYSKGSSDCGRCQTCKTGGGCNLISNADPRDECNGSTGLFPGQGACCAGVCYDKASVTGPWGANPADDAPYNQIDRICYELEPTCVSGSMVYQTVTENCGPTKCPSGSCRCNQATGKCENISP